MIKLIDRVTGVEMWVADEKAKEYIEAGNKPASDPEPKKPANKGTRKKEK